MGYLSLIKPDEQGRYSVPMTLNVRWCMAIFLVLLSVVLQLWPIMRALTAWQILKLATVNWSATRILSLIGEYNRNERGKANGA